ncbi:MAG: thioredoxin domain-containing protein [Candidatus Paceibacterota bacterium]
MNNKINILSVVLLVIVASAVFYVFSDNGSNEPPFIHPKVLFNPPDSIYSVPPLSDADHIFGSKNAPVTVIEYSDTECPFCKKNYLNMKYLVNYYEGDISWVYRHHTLDHRFTKSRREAEASECAASVGGEGAFWLFLDTVYQITESNDSFDLSLLPSIVESFGVNTTEFMACVERGDHADLVERQNREAFDGGLEYTPSLVIFWPDGERRSFIIGARDRATIKNTLDYVLGREIEVTNINQFDQNEDKNYSE